MGENRTQKINKYTEASNSSPQRIRPTDAQMGLGHHNFLYEKSRELQNKKPDE